MRDRRGRSTRAADRYLDAAAGGAARRALPRERGADRVPASPAPRSGRPVDAAHPAPTPSAPCATERSSARAGAPGRHEPPTAPGPRRTSRTRRWDAPQLDHLDRCAAHGRRPTQVAGRPRRVRHRPGRRRHLPARLPRGPRARRTGRSGSPTGSAPRLTSRPAASTSTPSRPARRPQPGARRLRPLRPARRAGALPARASSADTLADRRRSSAIALLRHRRRRRRGPAVASLERAATRGWRPAASSSSTARLAGSPTARRRRSATGHGITEPLERVGWTTAWRGARSATSSPSVPARRQTAPRQPGRRWLAPAPQTDAVDLSVVVVFYNMRREAAPDAPLALPRVPAGHRRPRLRGDRRRQRLDAGPAARRGARAVLRPGVPLPRPRRRRRRPHRPSR